MRPTSTLDSKSATSSSQEKAGVGENEGSFEGKEEGLSEKAGGGDGRSLPSGGTMELGFSLGDSVGAAVGDA